MTAEPNRPRNRLLLRLRAWHARIGMVALVLLVLAAVTGIYLNHTALFRFDPAPVDTGELRTTSIAEGANLIPVHDALGAAYAEWGDVPVQFVQLREEGGRLVYKVRRRGRSDEVTVDARTGRLVAVRDQWRETRYGADGTTQGSQVSWTRILFDLHTGRILGEPGKLIADAGALGLLVLAGSGIYLFAVPRWRKWRTGSGRAPSERKAISARQPVGEVL